MIIVSDTSPICYLILIELIELLPQIYGQVVIPEAVYAELSSPQAPTEIRRWLQAKPDWLTVTPIAVESDLSLNRLDLGEREAILLAESLTADVVLIDETAARSIATERGLTVVGLLGVLGAASNMGLVEFRFAIERLQKTNMWISPKLIQKLLDKYSDQGGSE